jgi:hypothetical protein
MKSNLVKTVLVSLAAMAVVGCNAAAPGEELGATAEAFSFPASDACWFSAQIREQSCSWAVGSFCNSVYDSGHPTDGSYNSGSSDPCQNWFVTKFEGVPTGARLEGRLFGIYAGPNFETQSVCESTRVYERVVYTQGGGGAIFDLDSGSTVAGQWDPQQGCSYPLNYSWAHTWGPVDDRAVYVATAATLNGVFVNAGSSVHRVQ